MTLVIRPALLFLARSAALSPPPPPSPEVLSIIAFHIHPQSGIIESVETKSSQKKNELKYLGRAYVFIMISQKNIIIDPKVKPYEISSLLFANAISLISSKNNAYMVTTVMKRIYAG